MNGRKKKLTPETEFISKSQRKRDAQVVKSLAVELIRLSPSRLAKVPLDETVREAVEEARRVPGHIGDRPLSPRQDLGCDSAPQAREQLVPLVEYGLE